MATPGLNTLHPVDVCLVRMLLVLAGSHCRRETTVVLHTSLSVAVWLKVKLFLRVETTGLTKAGSMNQV